MGKGKEEYLLHSRENKSDAITIALWHMDKSQIFYFLKLFARKNIKSRNSITHVELFGATAWLPVTQCIFYKDDVGVFLIRVPVESQQICSERFSPLNGSLAGLILYAKSLLASQPGAVSSDGKPIGFASSFFLNDINVLGYSPPSFLDHKYVLGAPRPGRPLSNSPIEILMHENGYSNIRWESFLSEPCRVEVKQHVMPFDKVVDTHVMFKDLPSTSLAIPIEICDERVLEINGYMHGTLTSRFGFVFYRNGLVEQIQASMP